MELWQAALFGLVQGLTEFLPISSDGHLRVIEHFAGIQEPQTAFDVALHVATLAAVCIVLRQDIWQVGTSPFRVTANLVTRRYPLLESLRDPGLLGLVYVGLACVPTAYIGLRYGDTFESMGASLEFVGWMFVCNGVVLLGSRYVVLPLPFKRLNKGFPGMNALDALLIGAAQGMAVLRGVSRSGTTISVAMMLGVDRETAARFSFLAAIPAVGGAALLSALKVEQGAALPETDVLLAGMAVAFVVGLAAMRLLLRLVSKGKLHHFAWYTILVGSVLVLWYAMGNELPFWRS
jgi:undecaprenyl-diphosphatase